MCVVVNRSHRTQIKSAVISFHLMARLCVRFSGIILSDWRSGCGCEWTKKKNRRKPSIWDFVYHSNTIEIQISSRFLCVCQNCYCYCNIVHLLFPPFTCSIHKYTHNYIFCHTFLHTNSSVVVHQKSTNQIPKMQSIVFILYSIFRFSLYVLYL